MVIFFLDETCFSEFVHEFVHQCVCEALQSLNKNGPGKSIRLILLSWNLIWWGMVFVQYFAGFSTNITMKKLVESPKMLALWVVQYSMVQFMTCDTCALMVETWDSILENPCLMPQDAFRIKLKNLKHSHLTAIHYRRMGCKSGRLTLLCG